MVSKGMTLVHTYHEVMGISDILTSKQGMSCVLAICPQTAHSLLLLEPLLKTPPALLELLHSISRDSKKKKKPSKYSRLISNILGLGTGWI